MDHYHFTCVRSAESKDLGLQDTEIWTPIGNKIKSLNSLCVSKQELEGKTAVSKFDINPFQVLMNQSEHKQADSSISSSMINNACDKCEKMEKERLKWKVAYETLQFKETRLKELKESKIRSLNIRVN